MYVDGYATAMVNLRISETCCAFKLLINFKCVSLNPPWVFKSEAVEPSSSVVATAKNSSQLHLQAGGASNNTIEEPTKHRFQDDQENQEKEQIPSQQCASGLNQIGSYPMDKTKTLSRTFVQSANTPRTIWFRNSSSTVVDNGTIAVVAECYMCRDAWFHFPHGMQDVYRCWAWFEEQRQNSRRAQGVM
jgi:hypothetical protein